MNYKWIGAGLIIAGCAGVGVSMAMSYCREERELRQLVGALDYMACELQYRMTPLPDLCRQAGVESRGNVGKVLLHLAQELESKIHEDVESSMTAALVESPEISTGLREAFRILGTSLGRFDLEGQIQGLEYVRSHCRSVLEKMAAGKENRLRSFQTLGICAGAALAILFV